MQRSRCRGAWRRAGRRCRCRSCSPSGAITVRLITRPSSGRGLAVSLPPSCGNLFDAIGVSDAIERAGFWRSTGNTVWWGGGDARVESFADGARGWQLDVERLSEVHSRSGHRRRRAGRAANSRPTLVSPPESFVLDCSGRAGLIARAHGPAPVGRRTADDRAGAANGSAHGGWPVPDDTHTLIESYDDGWMWSVPIAHGRASHRGDGRSRSDRIWPEADRPRPCISARSQKTRIFSVAHRRRRTRRTGRADSTHPRIAPPRTPVNAGCWSATPDRSSIRCRRRA